MQYYQKDDVMFYQFDTDNYIFIEVFSSLTQKRVMKVSDVNIYSNTLQRIINNGFVALSEEVFIEKLNNVKAEI